MISRKKILSRSQSEIDYPSDYDPYECEDDIWYNKEKLFADHIQEILKKWEQIDDEIWGKVICMERNRRVAKAYARVPVLTVSGSNEGFDGYKIGLNGFETPMNDPLVKRVKNHIGKGVRIKMDDLGNIIIKRMSSCDVFIRGYDRDSNSLSKEILDLSGELGFEKSAKLFDMKKFQSAISKELRSAYPDRKRLENQCISVIAFVKDASDVLDLPVWCMIINIVALDMLKSRLPPMSVRSDNVPKFVSIFNKQDAYNDEDPYSVPSLPTSKRPQLISKPNSNNNIVNNISKKGDVNQKPPELPPRDFAKIKKSKGKNIPKVFKNLVKSENRKETRRDTKKEVEYEDPYYCGMQARVSNFSTRERKSITVPESLQDLRKSHSSGYLNSLFNPSSHFYPSRGSSHYSYYDSCFESDPYVSSGDGYDNYAPIYGRLPHVSYNRKPKLYLKKVGGERYATEWD